MKKHSIKKAVKSRVRSHKKSRKSDIPSYVYVVVGIVVILIVLAFARTVAQGASLHFDSPIAVIKDEQLVLGDSNDESGKEAEKKLVEQQKEESKSIDESENKIEEEKSTSVENNGNVEVKKINKNESKKFEYESESTTGEKIKVKIEDDGTTKIELEHGELKVKYRLTNGEIVKKIEDADGKDVQLNDGEVAALEDESEKELADNGIEISTESGVPTFAKNGVFAKTEFPLSIDVGTHTLQISTKNGDKEVTILPDQAVQQLVLLSILDQSVLATGSGSQLTDISLLATDGIPVYEIQGVKTYKLFSFIPLVREVKAVVSAETGDIVTTQQSFLTNLIDLLSP